MTLRSWIAFMGSIIGVVATAVLYFAVGTGWASLGIVVGLSLVSYIVAAASASSLSQISTFEELMRGWLIGFNAGLNAFIIFAIVEQFSGPGVIIGTALGLLNLLVVFRPISQSEFYQGLIGYLNWVFPMSWLIVGLGFLFYFVSWLLHVILGKKYEYLRILDQGVDWKTGTFFIKGGLVANLNYTDAFNMGNFAFVDYKAGAWHKEHEAGHTLNLAAFGSVFHLIGALDENVVPARHDTAYSERLAGSNDSHTSGPNIPMWA